MGPALPVCSFCGYPKPIGTFSDDPSAYICIGCPGVAKQFLEIQDNLYNERRPLVSEDAQDDQGATGPRSRSPI